MRIGEVSERRTGVRYSVQTVTKARKMHAAGWSIVDIARILGDKRPIAWNTVYGWVDESFADQQRAKNRARRAARRSPVWVTGSRPEYMEKRVVALRGAGLSHAAIAKVMRLDFGVDVTHHQVRYALSSGRRS